MIRRRTKITVETHRLRIVSHKKNAARHTTWKHFAQYCALYSYGVAVGVLSTAATLMIRVSLSLINVLFRTFKFLKRPASRRIVARSNVRDKNSRTGTKL